ncbi:hypothetical protein [Paenibacillus macerans]|uniref:Putative lipoprotein n=1 Tax=Paenibacillus macerans TaxID=44252 RepID=A0A090ZPI9_PAEMA|nr:hypothetical protein [Paenibacillus macerans]KFN12358.1 putative lipoprotein [Paenibacillus macerans]MCY7558339.1 hypothetical protein [Paenibacillus macerans]MEC0150324.1 hypothetical protein [Paenibacillus macerans]SUA84333.1 Uncharacterised protein [Paenibacillus macerans]GBK60221.1 hypothetical protein PbDSM24746_02250 [Paenibacillus macerans]
MKAIKLLISGIACLIFLTGCNEFYQPVAKDTVMIKKINQVMPENKLEYPGTLSEDTVKTLSVDAVNRLLKTNLLVEDINLEVSASDLQEIKSMLYSIIGDTSADPLVRYKTELNAIPNGIYRVIITNPHNPYIQYTVALNSKDGDILEINNYARTEYSPGKGSEPDKDEAIFTAKQFLKRLSDVNPDELELGKDSFFWGATNDATLFFRDKKTKKTRYVVSVDSSTKEISGFSKGIMTVLSYSYLANLSQSD